MDDNGGLREGAGESSWPPCVKLIHDRLVEIGNEEALSGPGFRRLLDEHFERLPASYAMLQQSDKAEDVLLHRRILTDCDDPNKRPVFHARFIKCIQDDESLQEAGSPPRENGIGVPSNFRRNTNVLLHEIIFASIDKPKLLCLLSRLIYQVGLNIREAHVFSTTGGLCLAVFLVDGWHTEEADGLLEKLKVDTYSGIQSLFRDQNERNELIMSTFPCN